MTAPTTTPSPETRGDGERRLLLTTGGVLALTAWLLAVPYLVFAAAITSAPFFGEQPSDAELREAAGLLRGAAAAAGGLPVVAVLLLRAAAHRWAARVAGCCAVVGLVAAGWLLVAADDVTPQPPEPPRPAPTACVERSGPPATCPGG